MYNEKEKREIIMSHYLTPIKKGKIIGIKGIKSYANHCIDKTTVYINIKNNKIIDIKHESIGCSLFQSSIDIFCTILLNKTLLQTEEIIKQYENMILGNKTNINIIGKLIIFNNVGKNINRVECALLTAKAIKNAINYK